jgi:hypothetical protein
MIHEHILNLPEKRAQQALTRLVGAYQRGELAHESDLLSQLTSEYTSLFTGLTDPSIAPIDMRGDLPRVSAVRRPLEQLDSDLETCFEQLSRLRNAVANASNITVAEKSGIEQLLSRARDRIIEAKSWASESDSEFLWVNDTLKTTNRVDASSSARIDTTLGIATLAIGGESPLSERVASVTVQHVSAETKEVDGLPGNWLELAGDAGSKVVQEVANPVAVTFTGNTYKDSANPASMFDGDPSSWFEWEKYMVPAQQKLVHPTPTAEAWVIPAGTAGQDTNVFGPNGVTKDFGWEYAVNWPADDVSTPPAPHWIVTPATVLPSGVVVPADYKAQKNGDSPFTLQMEVQFDSQQELSWIELLPYIPPNAGDFAYRLESLYVSPDGVNEWVNLIQTPLELNPAFDQPIDTTRTGLPVKDYRGTAVVPCNVPRVKAIRILLTQDAPYSTDIGHKFFVKTTVTNTQRSSWFGLSSSSSTNTAYTRVATPALSPETNSGRTFVGWGKRVTVTDTDVSTYYDILRAYRYCIGVRDLGLFKRQYEKSSRLVTKPLVFEKNVTAASLLVSEIVPEMWSTSQRWISYEISHDGSTWQPIVPQNTDGTTDGVIRFPATRKLFLRVTFNRPDDRSTETPILEYYAIKAIPESA